MEEAQNKMLRRRTSNSSLKIASFESDSSRKNAGTIDNCSTEETEDLSYNETIAERKESEVLPLLPADNALIDDDLVKESVVLPFLLTITNGSQPEQNTIDDCEASSVPSQADTDSSSIGDDTSTGSMTEDMYEEQIKVPTIENNPGCFTPKFIKISEHVDNNVYSSTNDEGLKLKEELNTDDLHAVKVVDNLLECKCCKLKVCRKTDRNCCVEVSSSRKVTFCNELVTEVHEIPRWSKEDKPRLFYTGREMNEFRIDYIVELNTSQSSLRGDGVPNFEKRGGIRIFWSLYGVFLDFFTCKAVVQFCC